MKLEDDLIELLIKKGFNRVEINANGIHLFYLPLNDGVKVVSIFSIYDGEEMTAEGYQNLITNMKNFFADRNYQSIHMLGVILTNYPEKVRSFCADEDTHWIIDLTGKRLIIYENQASDFLGLKSEFENLMDTQYSADTHRYFSSTRKVGWITLFNSIIIILNIIIYLLTHYTNILGKPVDVMENGSLSWYPMKEGGQYYRILTSMFLHYNLGHLFNNMLVLFFVGDNLERAAGRLKYLLIYFGSGILAGITSISYNMLRGNNEVYSVGASGAIFGIVGAMGYILIRNNGRLEDFRTSQLILFAAFSLYGGIISANIDNAAHIGGFIAGILLALLLYRKPKTVSV